MESTMNELITNESTSNVLKTNESKTNELTANGSTTNETTKLSQAEIAQLRAEMRRRKILQRGDERIRKLFGESKDEELNSVEERNKNLIEQIKKDPVVLEKINSFDKTNDNKQKIELVDIKEDKQQTNLINTKEEQIETINEDKQINNQLPKINKPIIDLSYFEKLEAKEKLKKERLELSRLQILIIHLINLITLNRDLILINLIKILIACLSSYFNLNIVTPFIISQSIGFLFIDFISNHNLIELNRFKLSYSFFKNNLLDSFNFLFIYIIIQTLLVLK